MATPHILQQKGKYTKSNTARLPLPCTFHLQMSTGCRCGLVDMPLRLGWYDVLIMHRSLEKDRSCRIPKVPSPTPSGSRCFRAVHPMPNLGCRRLAHRNLMIRSVEGRYTTCHAYTCMHACGVRLSLRHAYVEARADEMGR